MSRGLLLRPFDFASSVVSSVVYRRPNVLDFRIARNTAAALSACRRSKRFYSEDIRVTERGPLFGKRDQAAEQQTAATHEKVKMTIDYSKANKEAAPAAAKKAAHKPGAGGKKPANAEPRPSASIILVSPTNEILLLHRVKTSSSFPSAHVFPGGNLSARQDGEIPPPSSPARHIDGPVYRLGAIRECFEESGILLAKRRDGTGMLDVPAAEREAARKAVHANKLNFDTWVKSMGGVVDYDGLFPFTRWITPVNVPRRFTTQMYVYFWPLPSAASHASGAGLAAEAGLPITQAADIPDPTDDGGKEHTEARFASCASWLEEAGRNEIILFPPQYYLIWHLSKFLTNNSSSVAELEAQREAARRFLRGSGTNGVPWADKVTSPTAIGFVNGRSVLSVDVPGPELKGSGRRGESGDNVLVRFSKEGPRDVRVISNEEAKRLIKEAEAARESKI